MSSHNQNQKSKVQKIGELIFSGNALSEAERRIRAVASPDGFTLAEARDALHSTRKYVLPLLEAMDMARITLRTGEKRVFVRNA